jgi:hypothetical protein
VVLVAQALPTGFVEGCWIGVFGFTPSGVLTGGVLGPLVVPAAPGTLLTPPVPGGRPLKSRTPSSAPPSAPPQPAQTALMTPTLSRLEPTLAQRGCIATPREARADR